MSSLAFAVLVATCAPQVDPATARALVATESGFNAYAIGVVGGRLDRQPRSSQEGLETAHRLQAERWNYSAGLAQINVRNFQRLGLTTASAFEPCANLAAMQSVLSECYARATRQSASAQRSLRLALSCYYSGNFVTGFEHGYVRRVLRMAAPDTTRSPSLVPPSKDLP